MIRGPIRRCAQVEHGVGVGRASRRVKSPSLGPVTRGGESAPRAPSAICVTQPATDHAAEGRRRGSQRLQLQHAARGKPDTARPRRRSYVRAVALQRCHRPPAPPAAKRAPRSFARHVESRPVILAQAAERAHLGVTLERRVVPPAGHFEGRGDRVVVRHLGAQAATRRWPAAIAVRTAVSAPPPRSRRPPLCSP